MWIVINPVADGGKKSWAVSCFAGHFCVNMCMGAWGECVGYIV